jgi:cation transport ATPase
VDAVAFDKTGTLTLGKMTVTDFIYLENAASKTPLHQNSYCKAKALEGAGELKDDVKSTLPSIYLEASLDLLKYLAIAEAQSSHPIAKAIHAYCTLQLMTHSYHAEKSFDADRNGQYNVETLPGKASGWNIATYVTGCISTSNLLEYMYSRVLAHLISAMIVLSPSTFHRFRSNRLAD